MQLENQQKLLLQKQKEDDRKARSKRLTQREAILESLISGSDKMSNEQMRDILMVALSGKPTEQAVGFIPTGTETMPREMPKTAAGAED